MLTSLLVSELHVRALGRISRGHDRRYVTAGLIMAMSSGHRRHGGSLEVGLSWRG